MSHFSPMACSLALALLMPALFVAGPCASDARAMASPPPARIAWKPVCFDECTTPAWARRVG